MKNVMKVIVCTSQPRYAPVRYAGRCRPTIGATGSLRSAAAFAPRITYIKWLIVPLMLQGFVKG